MERRAIRRYSYDFRQDSSVLGAIERLIAPSYEGSPAMLTRDVRRCDRLYTLSIDEDLACFFMVGFTALDADVPAVYLGLSATADRHKNSGIVRGLFAEFTRDAQAHEGRLGREVVMFGTLATPSSFHGVRSAWRDAQPALDGTYRPTKADIATLCARWLDAKQSNDHPFVLPACADGTRYSVAERERIATLVRKHDFRLFALLGIEESRGDRLLVTCRVPRASSP